MSPRQFHPADAADSLRRTLTEVAIPGVRFAVLLHDDGRAIEHSSGVDRSVADRVAAVAAGLRSLAKAMAELCGDAPVSVSQCITERGGGLTFVSNAGPGVLLAVATTAEVDVVDIARRLTEIAAGGQEPSGGIPSVPLHNMWRAQHRILTRVDE